MATLYVGSDQTYKTIQEAINAASTTEETTIILSAGTYADDVNITVAAVGEQKGNIKIAAAEGADVTVSGLVTIGYYEKRVGSQKWDAEIAFEGITFDQATDEKHSIDIQQVKDFSMTNCKVIGGGEYGMLGTNVDNGATISQCIFENAGIQSAGNFGTNMLIADCIFNESKVNIQSGNSVMVRNCTFNSTLKEANVDDSFYCIRSNDNAITLNGCQFNIDSELTSVASEQTKWGVLWQCNAGGTKWRAFNCQFNLTDAAMQQSELLVNKNATTTDANKAGRIVIYAFNSVENDVADLLAKTEGIITVVADAKYAVYDNGVPVGDVVDVSNIYIDNRYTADNVGELVLGVNAFTAVDSRVMAIAASAKATLTVNEGAVVEHDTLIANTIIHKDSEDWFYTDYLREDGFVAKNVKVDGTFKAYHIILNNADTVVSTTGRIRTDEDLRILGGTFTATGSRNGETADDLYTGSWGNDIAWTDAAQFKVSYLKVVYGAEAVFNNSNIVVWAQSMDVGTYWTATADNPSTGTLTLNDSYMIVGDWNTISVADNSVLNLNGSTIQADNDANSDFRAKMVLNGTLNMSADSLLVLGDMTVGDNGKIVIDAANFTGTKKLIDLNDNESLDGKVTFTNLADNVRVIYGADGDVTLSDADMTKLYVNAAFTENNLAAGQILGINAFTGMTAALKAVAPATESIEVTGDVTEDIPAEALTVTLSKDLIIAGSGETASVVTLNNGGYQALIFGAADGAENIDVKFENIQLIAPKTQVIFGNSADADDGSTVYSPVNAEIDGSSQVSAYVVAVEYESTVNVLEGGKFFSTGEVMSIKGTLNATGNDAFDPAGNTLTADDRQIVAHYMWDYGTVELNDTFASIYSQLRLRGADSSFTADNSLIEIGKKVDGTWMANPSANGVGWINADGTMTLTNKTIMRVNGATGRDGYGMTINAGGEFNVESGSTAEFSAGVKNDGTINVENGTLITGNSWTAPGTQPPATALVNNGTIEVSGESTLNIAELSGNTIDFMDGAIIKDSTVGGGVFVAGNVTFRGDNTFGMITDFGTLTDYYGTTAPMAWTVEAGASVTLNNKARYGLGYGDKVVVNGEIAENGAAAARAALNDDDASNDVKQSLFMHGLVAQESAGWNCDSSFTVNNAFVTIGSNSSFGSKAGNYGGNYTFNFNNSVLNASRITFYNTNAKTTFTLTGSDVELGQFMTRDQDSVFTLDNSKLVSTSTINGNDEGQYNAGTLNLINGSTLTYSIAMTNEATGKIVISADSKLIAPEIIMVDGASITIDGTGFAGGVKKIIDLNGTESLAGKVTLINGEGLSLIYGDDGDVMLSDASKDTLYVNAAWADKKAGDEIEAGKVFGVNAFANSKDALTAANAEGGAKIIVDGMGSDMVNGYTVKLNNAGTYTITGGTGKGADLYGVTVQNGSAKLVFDDAYFAIGKLYLPNKGTSLTVTDSIIGTTQTDYAGHKGWLTANQGSMSFDNSIVGINFNNFTDEEIKAMPRSASEVKAAVEAGTYKYWTNDYTLGGNNGPHFGTAADVTVTDSTLSTTWISLIDRAEMSLDNSVLYYGGAVSIGTGWVDDLYKYNSNEIGWDAQVWWGNYPATSPEGFREGEVATLNITDSIVRNIGGGNGNDNAHFQVGGTVYGGGPLVGKDFAGVLNLTNSELYTTMYNSNGEVMEREGDLLVVKSNGTVNMKDSKLVTSKVINNGVFSAENSTVEVAEVVATGAINVDGGNANVSGAVTLNADLVVEGITAGDAREITVALIPAGATEGGQTVTVTVAKDATTAVLTTQDIADGNYDLTIIDGNIVKSGTASITNGKITVTDGKFTAGTLSIGSGAFDVYGASSINIATQNGTIKVNDGAVISDSKVGNVNVYGKTAWQGTNTINEFSVGWYNSGADIETTITGTANVNNFMIGNTKGFTSTLNIGDAAGNRTTINGNQHNYTSNSIVNVNNADLTGNYASMTGEVNVTDSTYSKFGDFRVVAGAVHTITPKAVFTRSSISGAYGYVGGWSAADSGYGILELNDNSTWQSSGASLTTADSEVSVDASKFIVGGAFTNNGKFSAANGSTVTVNTLTNGGTITITDSTFTGKVTNNGSFTVGGASALDISSFIGKLDIAAGTEFTTFSVNMTGDADSVVAADDLTLVWKTLTGAETLTVADKLAFTGVDLPTTSAVTVFTGNATFASLEINGSAVVDNQIMVGDELYDVTVDASGITLNAASDDYTPISGGITSVTQGDGNYTFAVTADITGGEGDYSYSFTVTDASDKELALTSDGMSFTLTDIPAAGTGAINVTMTVTDAFGVNSSFTTQAFAADVADYNAPVFAEGPEVVLNGKTAVVNWVASDDTDIAGYEITMDGEDYEIHFGINNQPGSFSFKKLAEGKHTFTVSAYDGAGNKVTSDEQVAYIQTSSKILDNGYSQIVGWDAGRGALGYIANTGNGGQWVTVGFGMADIWDVVAVGKFGNSKVDNDGVLLYNKSNHTFAAWTDLSRDDRGYQSLCWVESEFATKTIANLDGDGFDDVLIANDKGSFGAVLNAMEYKDIWHADDAVANVELIGAGSFGADDGLDSLLVKNGSQYQLWHNSDITADTWNWESADAFTADDTLTFAGIGDFSGDGVDDVVMWNKASGELLVLDDGVGSAWQSVGTLDAAKWEIAAVGDYNGNGQEDLLIRELTNGWGGLSYLEGAAVDSLTSLNSSITSNIGDNKFEIIA